MSQIFYLNFVIMTKNLSIGVNRNIITYSTTYDKQKMWQTVTLNEMYTIFIVSEIWKKKPTNAYTFIITPQYLKRVEVEE